MIVINTRNVHTALPEGLRLLSGHNAVEEPSRNGPVRVCTDPVTTVYQKPWERVIFWKERDANPFFHLFESLHMLAGRNDIAYLSRYAANMASYSDDGVTQNGAYGHRWRNHFGTDQLMEAIRQLRADPGTRRVVLEMWDVADLTKTTKDKPCNTHIYLSIRQGRLDMTVCCRSNDMIWGGYGANAVHFSVMQEFVAATLNVPMGTYRQVSNNYHMYLKTMEPLLPLADEAADPFRWPSTRDPYASGLVTPCQVVAPGANPVAWLNDCSMFCEDHNALGLGFRFFRQTAAPMARAWGLHKEETSWQATAAALELLEKDMPTCDWRVACDQWLKRRLETRMKREGEQ